MFDQDQQAKAFVRDQRGEPEEQIVHAITACPMAAIFIDIGGVSLGADELKDWTSGARSSDPIVGLLTELADDHDRIRHGLTDGSDAEEMVRRHLAEERDAYQLIASLIDPRTVGAFDESLAEIEAALDEHSISHLGDALEDHIRLEETVLFPVALGALWKREVAARRS